MSISLCLVNLLLASKIDRHSPTIWLDGLVEYINLLWILPCQLLLTYKIIIIIPSTSRNQTNLGSLKMIQVREWFSTEVGRIY